MMMESAYIVDNNHHRVTDADIVDDDEEEEEWPSLNSPLKSNQKKNEVNIDDNWEMLAEDDDGCDSEPVAETSTHATDGISNDTSFEVIVSPSQEEESQEDTAANKNGQQETEIDVPTLRRRRGNSISSPDLRFFMKPDAAFETLKEEEDNVNGYADYDDCNNTTPGGTFADNMSFSMMSKDDDGVVVAGGGAGSASIITTSSSLTSCWSVVGTGLTFKEILTRNNNNYNNHNNKNDVSTTKKMVSNPRSTSNMSKARFVVVQPPLNRMKRCAYSTGDLKSLAVVHENEQYENFNDDDDDDDNYYGGGCGGDSVSMYQNHKSMGAKGHCNGLKIRPDEAKRLDMIMYKKNLQRQANASRMGGGSSTTTANKNNNTKSNHNKKR